MKRDTYLLALTVLFSCVVVAMRRIVGACGTHHAFHMNSKIKIQKAAGLFV